MPSQYPDQLPRNHPGPDVPRSAETMKRFITALTDHVFAQLERGKIKFSRGTQS